MEELRLAFLISVGILGLSVASITLIIITLIQNRNNIY